MSGAGRMKDRRMSIAQFLFDIIFIESIIYWYYKQARYKKRF